MARIVGTPRNDDGISNPAVIGTEDADTIFDLDGDDLVQGLGGADILYLGRGNDTVEGGDGDDIFRIGYGIDPAGILDGGAGADTIALSDGSVARFGQVSVNGVEHVDLNGGQLNLTADQLNDLERVSDFGLRGQLYVTAGTQIDLSGLLSGDGIDGQGRIVIGAYSDDVTVDASGTGVAWGISMHGSATFNRQEQLLGGAGNDTLFSGGAGDTILGGSGDDVIEYHPHRSGQRPDPNAPWTVINGGEGHDTFRGLGLQDYSRTSFQNIEILEGGGQFRRATLLEFEEMHEILSLQISTPGAIDLSGLVVSAAGERFNGPDFFRFFGSSQADEITWTDTHLAIEIDAGSGADLVTTGGSDDRITANRGNDTIFSGDGSDVVYGTSGQNRILTFETEADTGDTVIGGTESDFISTGAGNDSVHAGGGEDTLVGGLGADTLIGQAGADHLSGGGLSDLMFGGDGDDFLNGGFGFDRLNGGAGEDRFFHLGVAGHASDWVQDFSDADILMTTGGFAARDFQINYANTPAAGAADVDEAFVIYRPTGQIFWALVDGGDLTSLTLQTGMTQHDLLA
ncbi:calcium-binding protein [Shimia sp. SDUM112013]|uniref:calcium-binding protein n=1 Tax=Shimia sp. SDUM112013 TaxID=3136160 RepID=UPI0032EF0591